MSIAIHEGLIENPKLPGGKLQDIARQLALDLSPQSGEVDAQLSVPDHEADIGNS